jgi:hypothetical protein
MSRSSRPVPTAPSVPPASDSDAITVAIDSLEAINDRTHRYHQAINGLANFLFSVAGDEAGAPTPEVINGFAYLTLILADEGKRIDQAVEALETDLRRRVTLAGGAQ